MWAYWLVFPTQNYRIAASCNTIYGFIDDWINQKIMQIKGITLPHIVSTFPEHHKQNEKTLSNQPLRFLEKEYGVTKQIGNSIRNKNKEFIRAEHKTSKRKRS